MRFKKAYISTINNMQRYAVLFLEYAKKNNFYYDSYLKGETQCSMLLAQILFL